MTKVASLRGSAYVMSCSKCGNSLIAPEWAEYLSDERLVLNLWSCVNCGNRFETEAFAPTNAKLEIDSTLLEKYFSSALVA